MFIFYKKENTKKFLITHKNYLNLLIFIYLNYKLLLILIIIYVLFNFI